MDIDEAAKRRERLEPMRAAFRSIIEMRERNASRIPDLEERLVEMERSREFSACCGAGGGVKNGFPELAQAIGRRRWEMAEATGAELIATSCPWCEQNLADSMVGSEYRAEVKAILELVEESRIDKPYPG